MSLVSAKGSDINLNSNVDLKKVFIRLKDGGSEKVRVLGLTDYVEYVAHTEFNLGIYTQPCIAPTGKPCPLCIASKATEDGFDKLYARKRYLFAFACLETGDLKVWECSKGQAKDLLGQIAEYAEDINEVAFNFKRTGTSTETSYKLNPILKMKGNDNENFHNFDDVEVEMAFFESVLVPRSEDMLIDILGKAGLPLAKYFPEYKPEAPAPEANTAPTGTASDVTPIDDLDIPF